MKSQNPSQRNYLNDAESLLDQEGYIIIAPDEEKKDLQPEEKQTIKTEHVTTQQMEKLPGKKPEILPKAIEAEATDIPSTIQYLKWHMERIAKNVIGREEIIKQAMYAILTREHMLLLSRTGMAKSYLANYIFNTFDNVRVFASQASKEQTPDNYFGPYNIDEFKKGRIRHNIHGSIIEANLVFLDEFFDASDVVLRSLLSVLNERKFINGPEQIDVAIHTAIATANYMRMNEVTEAILDRFTYKSIIPEDDNVYQQLLIDHTYAFSRGKAIEPDKKIPFNQIIYLSDIVRNKNKEVKIEIPDFIYFMKNVITNKFVSDMRKSDYKFFISPRKQAKLQDFLRANALLNNRFEVTMDDLKDMYLALCTLNSFISVKAKDKSEKDVFLDAYQQTMVHFNATGAIQQIEFLLNLRRIFQEIMENPEKKERLLASSSGILRGLKNLLKKLFPSRASDDEITLETLKRSLTELQPAVEEVRELKEGITKDYFAIL
ncbi:MAG: MoxR family ATPase [Spirochaetes bacterium]|nr:AAA family ATPase [Spirochaetota bacterium]NMB65970.1 MoxR family ATPase [Spirochaetota bacterium]HOJ29518.1 AAA family ATPase [Spirochaetota bacterium]HOM10655.1 AAA family ATPase [Spirochaetota bacterium]HPP50475.1 AAA family ATPase [Spirochaetota bacterium]